MGINEIIVYIMVLFMALGAIDKCLGNKFGLGEKFEEGFMAMGSLALAMVGVICLAPVLANILEPIVVPVFNFLGADPGMFGGTLLANDMGGASLSQALAVDPQAGMFGGLIVGSMMGVTIVFTIPVALGIIRKEDQRFLAMGVLAGIITIPLGAFVGGLVAGFPVMMVLKNL
ncbi:MAG: ethanolamine utilization protein EutH, partial [Clostridium sp.]